VSLLYPTIGWWLLVLMRNRGKVLSSYNRIHFYILLFALRNSSVRNFYHSFRLWLNLAFFVELSLEIMDPVDILLLFGLELGHAGDKPLLYKFDP
jgi:hypothetical protein